MRVVFTQPHPVYRYEDIYSRSMVTRHTEMDTQDTSTAPPLAGDWRGASGTGCGDQCRYMLVLACNMER